MSQAELGTLDTASVDGVDLAALLLGFEAAIHSNHSGASRPGYLPAGGIWLKTTVAPWEVYIYDGAQDILVGTVNTTTNKYSPARAVLVDEGTQLSAGYSTAAYDHGTLSGSVTPDVYNGHIQKGLNNGAFTLVAPSAGADYTIILCITNGASAGAVTFSGFEKKHNAEPLTTTNGHSFLIFIYKINGIQTYSIFPRQ